ncbi:MAG: ubiquinol-cytochrome c reductase iron-sulfur subunit, partial [Proteobacteria bacterium]|nr:ubiquinol-cytochrome c reductase iron-sulfur subunit [Pseudomonadota bacterium]
MTEDDLDGNRRHFLAIATAVTGAVGAGFVAVPFLSSLQPSARAQALGAPVEIPLGFLDPGEMIRVLWRGRLVFVLRRTEDMLGRLGDHDDSLKDPHSENAEQQPGYAANETRSRKREYLIVEGSCTHLGCAPIEDFDVVVAREAPRYEGNWFTKLDDFLQPLLGRNRELQKTVRNIFVARDVYVARQGNRMRLSAREWIGRHRSTLGLVTGELDPLLGRVVGQQKRGYALAVEVRTGAKIPRKARQHLNDIIEHPDDYIITPEQRAALDEYDDIFENLVRAEQRHGVDVEELWGAYAPRLITKAPAGQNLEVAVTQLGTSFPSTHPWYTKSRAMPDVRQLFAAGYELGDPLAAMEVRLAADYQPALLGGETFFGSRITSDLVPLLAWDPQLAEGATTIGPL